MLPYLSRLCLVASIALATPMARAEDMPTPPEDDQLEQGLDRLSEGSRMLLEGLAGELAPLIAELSRMMDQLNAYHPPEVLPNGDIIIRKRTPDDADPEPVPLPEGQIEI